MFCQEEQAQLFLLLLENLRGMKFRLFLKVTLSPHVMCMKVCMHVCLRVDDIRCAGPCS